MNWRSVFLAVTACALAGMLMGGLFGWGAGRVTPDFFRHLIPWRDVEPVGFAVFLGSTVGIILGGSLGCFALLLQVLSQSKKRTVQPDERAAAAH